MKRAIVLMATIALSSSLMAVAQTAPPELTPEHFAALNGKNPGGVSQEEYETLIREAFHTLDTDRSGGLSRAETAKALTPERFAALDEDKNGDLTLDELIKQITRDTDRPGGPPGGRSKP